jgi:hypothetical protein
MTDRGTLKMGSSDGTDGITQISSSGQAGGPGALNELGRYDVPARPGPPPPLRAYGTEAALVDGKARF